jgi:hypothetical protein
MFLAGILVAAVVGGAAWWLTSGNTSPAGATTTAVGGTFAGTGCSSRTASIWGGATDRGRTY